MFTRLLLAFTFSSLAAQAQPPVKPDPLKEAQAALKALGPAPSLPAQAQVLKTDGDFAGKWKDSKSGSVVDIRKNGTIVIDIPKSGMALKDWKYEGTWTSVRESHLTAKLVDVSLNDNYVKAIRLDVDGAVEGVQLTFTVTHTYSYHNGKSDHVGKPYEWLFKRVTE